MGLSVDAQLLPGTELVPAEQIAPCRLVQDHQPLASSFIGAREGPSDCRLDAKRFEKLCCDERPGELDWLPSSRCRGKQIRAVTGQCRQRLILAMEVEKIASRVAALGLGGC
jgi:hypothetical protein